MRERESVQHTISKLKLILEDPAELSERKSEAWIELTNLRLTQPDAFKDLTTNLYITNLAPSVTEDVLRTVFSKHGRVTSVKIMTYPTHRTGFVAYMTTTEAERAKNYLNGFVIDGSALSIVWARHAPAIPAPNFVPPPSILNGLTPGGTAGPTVANLDSFGMHTMTETPTGPAAACVTPPCLIIPAPPCAGTTSLGADVVIVRPPSDPTVASLIDRFAKVVAQHGSAVEQAALVKEQATLVKEQATLVKEQATLVKEQAVLTTPHSKEETLVESNESYPWIHPEDINHYYYLCRVVCECYWQRNLPPPGYIKLGKVLFRYEHPSQPLVSMGYDAKLRQEYNRLDDEAVLTKTLDCVGDPFADGVGALVAKFSWVLKNIDRTNDSVKLLTAIAIRLNAPFVVHAIVHWVLQSEVDQKVACIYVLNDLLCNVASDTSRQWNFKVTILQRLPEVFAHLGSYSDETVGTKISTVLSVWRACSLLNKTYLDGLESLFYPKLFSSLRNQVPWTGSTAATDELERRDVDGIPLVDEDLRLNLKALPYWARREFYDWYRVRDDLWALRSICDANGVNWGLRDTSPVLLRRLLDKHIYCCSRLDESGKIDEVGSLPWGPNMKGINPAVVLARRTLGVHKPVHTQPAVKTEGIKDDAPKGYKTNVSTDTVSVAAVLLGQTPVLRPTISLEMRREMTPLQQHFSSRSLCQPRSNSFRTGVDSASPAIMKSGDYAGTVSGVSGDAAVHTFVEQEKSPVGLTPAPNDSRVTVEGRDGLSGSVADQPPITDDSVRNPLVTSSGGLEDVDGVVSDQCVLDMDLGSSPVDRLANAILREYKAVQSSEGQPAGSVTPDDDGDMFSIGEDNPSEAEPKQSATKVSDQIGVLVEKRVVARLKELRAEAAMSEDDIMTATDEFRIALQSVRKSETHSTSFFAESYG
ncbi:RNA recognition motif protein [Gregarina niphandrodes]|uniref:RNA recognition motif protein n=1 Tax=Gregarina niphandrodes TaxID=110365 RepID=A0A023AZ61_GRENI|nr:RNA recognition motif protein [Gregarina niphandrodes]EZG43939.1 RNA recognition motif protein [Gregarina niphandrodes]|eukprot:XP_011132910.1 RNA recognition motif protein [Gregarina niphandrodes]